MTQLLSRNVTARALICALLTSLIIVNGCHRGYYRRMADAEAKKLVEEKNNDPRWSSPTANIEVDPQSRMFDPFSKDHPPLPPDDPASGELMTRVDGRKGYPHWHANGDTCFVESPEWRGYLPMDSQGRVIINIDTAIELSLVHSPSLQRQREDLYLSALDVSLERFGFDSQLFAGFNSFYSVERGGSALSTGFGSRSDGFNYRKLGITGANFAVGLANTVLWTFGGPSQTQTGNGLINFAITQPLLRGAGRDRIMESLTQSERDLLGNVRTMERFRQGFYLEVVTGRQAGPGPANTQAGGILGLLENQQQIRYAEFNVIQQSNSLVRLRELFSADQINSLQVQQTEITLYSAQQQLINRKVNYQNTLDRFKITLGLPPDLDVVVKDDFLDQFILISDELLGIQLGISSLRLEYGTEAAPIDSKLLKLKEDHLEALKTNPNAVLVLPETLQEDLKKLRPFIESGNETLQQVRSKIVSQIEADFAKLATVRPKRIAYLAKMREQMASGEIPADIEVNIVAAESIVEVDALKQRLADALKSLDDIETKFDAILERINAADQILADPDRVLALNRITEEIVSNAASQLTALNSKMADLSLIQVLARSNSIELIDIDLSPEEATEIARCFRLDWMNARAGLVDAWRRIEFVADQLESQFDLIFDGDMGSSSPNNPFKINYKTGTLRAGFRFDSPIVRLSERNAYQTALINYQRARRSFYQFEDEVKRNLRLELRTVNQQKTSFELQRRLLQVSVQNLEQSNLVLEQPPRFQAGGARTQGLGATTARDLTGAINQLNQAQGNFLNSWLSYEVLRRSLDYDLGTIQVDQTGRWIDPQIIDREIGYRTAALMGLDPSCLDCNMPPEFSGARSNPEAIDDSQSPALPP
ncbi:MAG: hypothetical protein ABL888_12750 [Pirellulaceae bacterium]